MNRVATFALVALLAVSFAAEASAAFCRTSSYKTDLATIKKNKMAMFKNCNAMVTILSEVDGAKNTAQPGCAQVKQQVSDEAAWKKYSDCEKSAVNAELYKPLKDASAPCAASQSQGMC